MYEFKLAPCPKCGSVDVESRCKASPILCYYIRCNMCGRETAKHRKVTDANRDWNLGAERFYREEKHGTEM